MRLSTRLTLAMVVLVLLTATAVGYFTYRNVEAFALPRGLDRIDTRTRVLAAELEADVRAARADAIGFSAAAAVEGIIRSRLAGGVDPVGGTSEAQWRARMAARYMAELAAKPSYREFRVIGLDDGGREIVRVDRFGPDGATRVAPDAELARQGDRDFFRDAVKSAAGEVYVSPISLSRDNGAIRVPHIPILRIATPLHKPDGTDFGIVVINIDLRPAFDHIRSAGREGGRTFVVNAQGTIWSTLIRRASSDSRAARRFACRTTSRPSRPCWRRTTPARMSCATAPAPISASAGRPCGWRRVRASRCSRLCPMPT